MLLRTMTTRHIHPQVHLMKLWIISRSWRPDFKKWICLPHFLAATVPLMTRSDSTPNFHLNVCFRIFWESIAPSASCLVFWTRAQKLGEEACAEASPACCMPLIDEFLMFSFRVAVAMKEQIIADMFQVSIATVSQVTITWANYLFIVFSSINLWISREKIKASMPQKFLKFFPNVHVILDCTEVALETPSSLTLQSETFSAYKNHTTLKGLIGVAPSGLVTFISALYTGCISDKEITKVSGILPLLELGDEVMADKGFLIQDLLHKVGAKLIIPPVRHPGQFSKEETEETRPSLGCGSL
ncbi:uncharacterized protein LOC129351217 [Poeciliopsis prolifica]|uniref:uncharacterized protein LOC129351217 n=1 Tax=Poeciliopsis prolifica TaxID=188132 RepID=UPI0024146839|nr:uncharacterized protein LOC129351217 [Poeciliopsis prolifica]XP_054876071.1 uncharacterized protein LOC129351217 [Poeciliopsis prolifica]